MEIWEIITYCSIFDYFARIIKWESIFESPNCNTNFVLWKMLGTSHWTNWGACEEFGQARYRKPKFPYGVWIGTMACTQHVDLNNGHVDFAQTGVCSYSLGPFSCVWAQCYSKQYLIRIVSPLQINHGRYCVRPMLQQYIKPELW